MLVKYPVTWEKDDNGKYSVLFPDFPEAHTFGDDRNEALERSTNSPP